MRVRPLVALCLMLAAAIAACGESEPEPAATATPAAGSEPAIPPIELGEPGDITPSHVVELEDGIRFEHGVLETASDLEDPTTLAFGPDGRLYVGQLTGQVVALTLDGTEVVDEEVIAPEGVLQNVLGIAFNPSDAPEPVTVYVSHTVLFEENGDPLTGTVSKLTGPAFQREDIITGLTVSNFEHGTNGMAFDGAGRLLIAQGGLTNAGVPSERHTRPEMPLSSAILVADINDPGFDGAVTYEPPGELSPTADQASGDVRVYAAGFRNPFDLVVHSNGRIYATDNGPNPEDGDASTSCTESGAGPWSPDELNLIMEGHYYGHPNRNRARFDERQCTYRMPDDTSGESTAPLATLGYSTSANGLAEYTSDAFGGRMKGDLVYVEWAWSRVWRVKLADDGLSVTGISQIYPEQLRQPLDIAAAPDGTLFITELSADQVSYLRPSDGGLVE